MQLHRTENSDWYNLTDTEMNSWQKLASQSHAILTPANLVSIIGSAIAVYGLYRISRHYYLQGMILLLVGRFADILDGIIAESTKTKSSVGEAVDATMDKILIGITLIVLVGESILPVLVGVLIVAQSVYNIVLVAIAKKNNVRLHPSWSGKLSAFLLWLSIGGFILAERLKIDGQSSRQTYFIGAFILFACFIILAVQSSIGYTLDYINRR